MEKKLPFNIKYRSAIESGNVKLTTRRGNPDVTILRWDLNDPLNRTIVAILSVPGGYDYCKNYYKDGRDSLDNDQDDDLMVIPIMPKAKFKVGDEIVSKNNTTIKYEILEVGILNELGLYDYKCKLLTPGELQGTIRNMEIEKVDSWGILIEKPSRLEHTIANIIRRNFTMKIEDAYGIAKNSMDEIIDIVKEDYCVKKMKYPEDYLENPEEASDFELEVAKLMARCYNGDTVKSAEEEAKNITKYLSKAEGCGHIKGSAITAWNRTNGNTIPEPSLVRLPSGEIKIYSDNVKFGHYGIDYIPLAEFFTLPRA